MFLTPYINFLKKPDNTQKCVIKGWGGVADFEDFGGGGGWRWMEG